MPSAQRVAQRQSAWTDRLRDPVTLGLAALSVAAIAFAAMRGRQQAEPERVVRFVVATPDSLRPFDNFPWPAAISPDGSTIVYSVTTPAGSVLYSVKTDQLDPRLIPGTEQVSQPVFSPDGQWVCFEAGGKLKKVRLDGSAPVAITDAGSDNGGDWTINDEIVLGSEGNAPGLSKVSADGGELAAFVRPDSTKGESDYIWPIAFPDGKRVVFAIWSGSLATAQLATVSIDGGEVARLGIKSVRPLAVIGRLLVYVQADGLVMAVPLDRSGKKTDGRPTPVLDPVNVVPGNNGNSGIFVSRGGALITSRGGSRSTLVWIGKTGPEPISRDVRAFSAPRLSPDGKRIAAVVSSRDQSEIWIYDMETQTYSRLTNAKVARTPSWTPDGSRIVYIGLGGQDRFAIWSQAADGGSPAQKLLDVSALSRDIAVAPDGKSLTYTVYNNNSWDIFRVSLDGKPESIPYLNTAADEQGARVSPDGKWVAVSSNETDRSEVYLRSYPDPSSRVQVSAGGGTLPFWSPDGSKVYYRNGPSLMQARLSQSPPLRVLGRDTVIANLTPFYATAELGSPSYDISRDGRFVGLLVNRDDYQLVAVPNWKAELMRRMESRAKR